MIAQALRTATRATGVAGRKTTAAEAVVTCFTGISTTRTERIITGRAAAAAVFAKLMFAVGAGATFITRHGITAVSTGSIPPAIQGDVGRPWVVGLQDLLYQQKEISQATSGQSLADRKFAFPLAERIPLHMWMMHVIRARLCQRNNPIRLGAVEFTPAESNFKLAQIDLVQDHRRRADHDFLFGPVDAGFFEFVGQRTEFGIDFLQGWNYRTSVGFRVFALIRG